MSAAEDFSKLFFQTPTSFGGSVVITDPDQPPPGVDNFPKYDDDVPETPEPQKSFKADKLKVSQPKQASQQQPSMPKQHAPAPEQYIPPPQPQPAGQLYLKRGDVVGRGSFGTVYRCLDLRTGKLLADKEYIFDSSNVSQQIANAEREIQIMKELIHPNIVQYMGCQRNNNILDVFQEFITGGSIAKLLSTFGVFPEPLAREYTRQICEGLAYLHEHKIVHRDIKSANCLVTGEGVVKLADFGCSKSIETIMSFGQGCATLCGTPHYMAPEVIRQQRNVGRRSDIWSLGCTVIEMVTGSPPYAEIKNATACIFKIASTNEIPPIPHFCSPECTDFLKRCFVRDPMKRATAKELLVHPFMHREYEEDWFTMENIDDE